MSAGDRVNTVKGRRPENYHCDCKWCKISIGELKREDGSYYSRLERREYYDKSESGGEAHVAKTPLHIARFAIQRYSEPGDWVLDPTIGAGTTGVEALTQGRNVAGMEIQFSAILSANLAKNQRDGVTSRIRIGDARRIGNFLADLGKDFALVVNNPPYSGDEHMSTLASDKGKHLSGTFKYREGLPNLAFLKEGQEYWDTLGSIYDECIARLRPGGHFVYGVKDMMKHKKYFKLHERLNELLHERGGLKFQGTAFLRHHPGTQFLHTYTKQPWQDPQNLIHPPYYQTIGVFKKDYPV